ncbi:hypothetical protein AX17_000058 [Amanita inopinata Kibby_2008]|nr:hypothetical protein AX17_000058 [Amanita inopinata Kibby_2008]
MSSSSAHTSLRKLQTVVTTPPWARDEPSSSSSNSSSHIEYPPREPRPSDSASCDTKSDHAHSRWLTFTRTLPTRDATQGHSGQPAMVPKRTKNRSLSWLPSPSALKDSTPFMRKDKERLPQEGDDLQISVLSPERGLFTLAHNATPGWDTPWTSRPGAQGLWHDHAREDSYDFLGNENEGGNGDNDQNFSTWQRRRKRFRTFMLVNTYVPLLCRFINIALTTAALGIAIRIRQIEMRNNVMGAVGSSPTVVIIFAPLTLLHVMAAIYLEYFGRPLGLWKTSAKLAHTLSETLFICAWSAALSLCFDNFFTSVVPCASPSSIAWYNQIHRPQSGLPTLEGGIGDRICGYQVVLICLVGVGLLIYCISLIISLYRIFEKVKYHLAAPLQPS